MPEQSVADAPPALSERLQDVTEALAAARTADDVYRVVLHPALDALNAIAGAVLLVNDAGDTLSMAARQGYPQDAQTIWQDGPVQVNIPAGDALLHRHALFYEHRDALLHDYPELEARTGSVAPVATSVLPMFLDERPLGVLVLDFKEPHDFTAEERRFLRTLAAQCALALGRARLLNELTTELEMRRATERELQSSETRFRRLVEASPVGIAAGDINGRLILVNDAYLHLLGYTRDDFDQGRIDWASLTPEEYREADDRAFQQAFRDGASDQYEKEMLTRTGERLPLSLILMRYEERGQQLVVGYLQDLRAHRAAQRTLEEQRGHLEAKVRERTAELEARTRALESFAELTRDLATETDPSVLVRRAQEIVLGLLPEGLAVYYEPRRQLWHAAVQTGDLGNADLQRAINAGLPFETTRNLLTPWRTRQGYYQDHYDPTTDDLGERVAHIGASASLPLLVHGRVQGVFVIALFRQHRWSTTDRAVLETAVHSLGLALERAESIAHLEQRTQEVSRWRERYEVAVNGSGHLLYDWNPTTDQIVYGGAVRAITGYAPDDLAGNLSDWTERLIHPDDRDAFNTEIARVIEHSDTFHLEFRIVRQDGSVREVQDDGYFMRGPDGQVTHMVGFVNDVTEQRRTERELRAALRFNELILNNMGEGLTGMDTQGRTTFANPAALRMLGYTPEEFIGVPQHELIHHTRPDGTPYPAEACHIYAAFTDGQVHHVDDEVFWRRDGSAVPVDYTSTPIRNEHGHIEGAVLSFRDITARRSAEADLRRSNEELRRSNRELEQFAYIASHDLQAPARAVTSFADIIARRYAHVLDERGLTYLRQITEGGQHMKRLVDDLLTFSRVHTLQRPPERVHSASIFSAVLARLSGDLEASGAQVTAGPLPDVLADASQLDQVLQNLILNGVKYRREDVAPRLHVSAQPDGPMWHFLVQDNGIGIEEAYFERIFEIFQRLHTRDQYEGTGIGLAVCKKIIERHGGRLWVTSTPGEGSTFHFTLPRA
ncbi:PAS domain S-box protein [Deinococcus maricopensis]|uniref:histidine kinase n=1 Tax=Deinococcus maricopensis (strain DSM 21211 / LMG 22137 / NRRL B-23946 / LB-34) TaxID=709986 RepID=E8U9Y0_DEIML|nr:PAS domain S-box protein [Deinococcus maricopensis]ADV67869.1 multi-sensor signal transduction histidine kinase [Deinococcus maricopensis DSM 21211]